MHACRRGASGFASKPPTGEFIFFDPGSRQSRDGFRRVGKQTQPRIEDTARNVSLVSAQYRQPVAYVVGEGIQ
jgi:hypothetical protein